MTTARVAFFLTLFLVFVSYLVCDYPFTDITKIGNSFTRDINKKNWIYFRLRVNDVIPEFSETDALSFLVTPMSGDVDIYIKSSNFPTNPNCDDCWKSTGPSGDVVVVKKSDPMWPIGDEPILYIGIYAPETLSKFQLNTYLKDRSSMLLYTGVPQTAYSEKDGYVYFEYDLVGTHDLRVSVTPIEGDPDVFVSTTNPKPTPDSCDWSSSGFKLEWINIKTTDPLFKPDTKYYVGVRAYSTSYFVIMMSIPNQYDVLMEGTPLSAKVEKEKYNYYEFILRDPSTPNLVFSLNPLTATSDADIYVVYGTEDPKPGRDNYQWKSVKTGADIVEIKGALPGNYYIAIYGFHDSEYQITGATDRTTMLLTDGINQEGNVVPNVWKYYKYYHPDPDAGLTILLQPKSKWPIPTDVTFVVGLNDNTKPTDADGKYWKKADIIDGDSMLTVAAPTPVGNYYIGLISQFTTNFTISVKTNQSHTVLQDGVISFWNHVPEGSYRYFIFDDPEPNLDTTVTILPQGGDADLFMSQKISFPKEDSHTWSSTAWGDQADFITVKRDDEKRIQTQRFFIGVKGVKDTYFSIIAYTSDVTVELKDGASVSGTVLVGDYAYYKLPIQSRGAVTISLSVLGNTDSYDADIYASATNEKPNKEVYDWKSTKVGNDVINTPPIDPGYLYIGVLGVKAPKGTVAFTLQAAQDYSQVPLNYGSLVGVANAGQIKHYTAYIPSNRGVVIPSVSLINGRTVLYASSNATEPAGPNHYDWMSDEWPQNTIAIPANEPKFKVGTWTFGVLSTVASEFYVSISQSSQYYQAMLSLDIPISGIGAHMYPAYYKYKIPYEAGGQVSQDYYLDVRMFSGEVEVYTYQSYDVLPGPHNYTFYSRGKDSRLIYMPKELLKQGYLWIAVFGTSIREDNKFSLTMTKGDTPRLLPQDQPTKLEVKFRDYNWFKALNTHVGVFDLYADSCDNSPAPQIYGSFDFDHPSQQQFTFMSYQVNNGFTHRVTQDVAGKAMTYLGVTSVYSNVASQIYMTTSIDARPIVVSPKIQGSKNYRGDLVLKIGKAQRNTLKDIPLTYYIYAREVVYVRGIPEKFNMFTACGIEKNFKLVGQQTPEGAGEFVTYILNTLDYGKKYFLQVVVKDKYGLSAIYQPSWIINGELSDSDINDFPVGISLLVILTFFFGSIMYCCFGFIINIVRGKKGLQVIPHSQFWLELPILWIDGFKFIFTCGGVLNLATIAARKDKYKEFRDENEQSVNAPTGDGRPISSAIVVEREEDDENEAAMAAAASIKPTTGGGYGTV